MGEQSSVLSRVNRWMLRVTPKRLRFGVARTPRFMCDRTLAAIHLEMRQLTDAVVSFVWRRYTVVPCGTGSDHHKWPGFLCCAVQIRWQEMPMLWTIISAVAFGIGLAMEYHLPAEQIVVMLVAAVVISALGGGKLSSIIRAVLALGAMYMLVVRYAGGSDTRFVVAKLAEIVCLLTGIWVMVRGVGLAVKRFFS